MSHHKKPSSKRENHSTATVTGTAATGPDAPDIGRRGLSRQLWVVAAVLAAVVGVVFYQRSTRPEVYYTQGLASLQQNPAKADQLAQLAIDKSNGHYPEAQLLQCRALAATNQWEAALGGLALITDTSNCDPLELTALGETALKSQKFQLAELALETARKSEHPPARAFELLVPFKLQVGRPMEVLNLCRAWQKVNPEDPQAWMHAAAVEATQFDFGGAISDFREALRHQPPPEFELHIRKSLLQLLADTGDFSGARQELDIVKKSGPLETHLQLKSVQILRMEGQLKTALQEIEDYIKSVEASPEALKQRGILYLDLGDNDAAIRDLKAALDKNEFDKDAHFKLAQAYIRTGQKPLAEPHLIRQRELTEATSQIVELGPELERDPGDDKLRKRLEDLYRKIGRKPQSER